MTERLSPRANAALERLKRATQFEFDDALQALLDGGEGLALAAGIVERRMDGGLYVVDQRLRALVVATGSASLYAKAKPQLFGALWELIEMYRSGHPDPDIEPRLIDALYEKAGDDAAPERSYIAEAMREVGTAAALPALEAILFDGKPDAQAMRIMADAAAKADPEGAETLSRTWLLGVAADGRTKFLEKVAQAIDAIGARSAAIDGAPDASPTPAAEPFCSEDAAAMGARARQFPESAIVRTVLLRQGAERLCKDAYRLLGRENGGKPARKMTLDPLLVELRNSDLPDVFKIAMQTIQGFGNFAAHDQDGEHAHLTADIAAALQVVFEQAAAIYRGWAAARRSTGGAA